MDFDVTGVPGAAAKVSVRLEPAASSVAIQVIGAAVTIFNANGTDVQVGTVPSAGAAPFRVEYRLHFHSRPWKYAINTSGGAANVPVLSDSANEGLPDGVLLSPDQVLVGLVFK
ncbi:MAG TPA: hypothetical protein VG389_16320 [Myxococcota bacterium]|jgi:hypothetical protein|nr:hypothetical protein [Myxococcota bacterium]